MFQQQLFTNIFGKTPADERGEMLREVLRKYPYYGMAHYYLLQQADKNEPDYASIAGRTALHFNNPYYLNYILHTDTDQPHQMTRSAEKTIAEENPEIAEPVMSVENSSDKPKADMQHDELLFEPLHTTDYFASQGIKLSEEVKPDDKLGKQLRSFTDWLKTMKKVHEQRLPTGNAALDVNVQTIAEKSNVEEDVITESMADVYKEQGKNQKAREIYQKLSLLDPSKSAYFAAKIDSLKDL